MRSSASCIRVRRCTSNIRRQRVFLVRNRFGRCGVLHCFYTELHGVHTEFHGVEDSWARSALKTYSVKLRVNSVQLRVKNEVPQPRTDEFKPKVKDHARSC